MWSVIVTCGASLLLLGGYRLLWRRRYSAKWIDGAFVRVQGRIAGPPGEVVLRRTDSGELLRARGLVLERGGGEQAIDLRSPWLILIGRTARRGETVTVDGVPTTLPRAEALYRDAAVQGALEALRVAPGAWPELPLLGLPTALAALLLVAALALPRFVHVRSDETAYIPPPDPAPPPIELSCPAGTHQAGATYEAQCTDAAGRSQGPAVSYFTDPHVRRLRESGEYEGGRQHGLWLIRYWDGSLAEERHFVRGRRTGCWRSYHPDGRIRRLWCFEDGRSHGTFARWSERGQLVERGVDQAGSKHGLWQTWSEAGVLRSEGRYEADKREGPWRFWNADGGREARGRYRDGRHDGLWTFWHPTGQLAGRGRYRAGVKEGTWNAYYASGRLAAVASYRRGKRVLLTVWREEEWLAAADEEPTQP